MEVTLSYVISLPAVILLGTFSRRIFLPGAFSAMGTVISRMSRQEASSEGGVQHSEKGGTGEGWE